ncbi:ABC transporter permease [Bartonella sp. LJL80]
MVLDGYGGLILRGTVTTVELALLALAGALVLGLLGASCKLAKAAWLRFPAACYTTLIRAVPDLVIMLLLFFSLQIWVNDVTDWLGVGQLDIDPFSAGVITLSFIYGAYFTETFRGAFQAVSYGQLEAGYAYGMRPFKVFRRILFPLMMRHALPGITNNWQILLKATALVSIIGLSDMVKATQDAGKGTMNFFFYSVVAALIYLGLTTLSYLIFMWLDRRYSAGIRRTA